MKRRQLLLMLPLALGLPVLARRALAGPACAPTAPEQLASWLAPYADKSFGKLLASQPMAPIPQALRQVCSQEELIRKFQDLVASDFAGGHTQVVDGWILSTTEAFTHQLVYRYTSH